MLNLSIYTLQSYDNDDTYDRTRKSERETKFMSRSLSSIIQEKCGCTALRKKMAKNRIVHVGGMAGRKEITRG
jgi:hypothetical protein